MNGYLSGKDFDSVFLKATGHEPYCYQRDLALRPELPEALIAPTGAGKTVAVLMAWVWRRRFASPEVRNQTPRRLILCLPMRSLVNQTVGVVKDSLARLGILEGSDCSETDGVSVHVVMGGEADDSWVRAPEKESILVGTQDMLLSRALNRGYGTSRFRWPALFGLLNNDSLWVFDEIQLMGSGLYTSIQLEALRSLFGTFGIHKSLWMSATAEPQWLETVNRPSPASDDIARLCQEDVVGRLAKRLNANRTLGRAQVALVKGESKQYYASVASAVLEKHIVGTLTLVIANTVDRAVGIYQSILKSKPAADVMLIHSRFRPAERTKMEEILVQDVDGSGPGRIVVSTQVIEAGIDISARILFTELAPWGSLVQRWGRVNRAGEWEDSTIWWMDLPDEAAAPYRPEEMIKAREVLHALEQQSVAPSRLPEVSTPSKIGFAFRRRDFEELFDTTPDISGTVVDVSRFVRGQDDPDVRVFWREWDGDKPPASMPAPARWEVCSVPANEIRKLVEKPSDRWHVWRWDHVDGQWSPVRAQDVTPGQEYLLHSKSGGYNPNEGWNPGSKVAVADVRPEKAASSESVAKEWQGAKNWVSLDQHTRDVVASINRIAEKLDAVLPPDTRRTLLEAARWHDVGKSHKVFQDAMLEDVAAEQRPPGMGVVAKRPHSRGRVAYSRPCFRHELASALAVIQHGKDPLVAYLVASHHGKVRGAIRSLSVEKRPPDGRRFALGVWEQDQLPAVDLGGVAVPDTYLKLDRMELGLSPSGDASWVDMVVSLLSRRDLGPFRLAYLESLLVAADWDASAREGGELDYADDEEGE